MRSMRKALALRFRHASAFAVRLISGLIASGLAIASAASPAFAETRVALVIGNSAYKHAPALANPKNDAEGVAASLRRLKFDVLEGTDLDKPAMERLLQAFSLKLEAADVALVFYAGHGLQVHGRNYLVPIEAKLDREADLVFQAVPLDVIQGLMEQSQRTNIMILDACRDNPLARNLARTMGTRSASIGRGLGETKAGIGTLIVYATQPGNVALDGDTKNSPFTAALLKHIEAPGLEIRQVLTRVRNDVITATREKQVPWDSSSLRGDFFFASAPAAPQPEARPAAPRSSTDQETVFWQSIQNSKNAADFKDYLVRWPQGTFADLAKRRVAEIDKASEMRPAPVPAPPTQRADEPAQLSRIIRDCPHCPELIAIPPGRFLMGSPPEEEGRYNYEGPQRLVTIARPFALGRHAVTRGQWAQFITEAGHRPVSGCVHFTGKQWVRDEKREWRRPGFDQTDDHPVVCVSWEDATAYAAWLRRKTGRSYRLPSEAEFEYAARAGTISPRPWTNAASSCRMTNGSDFSLRETGIPYPKFADCNDGYPFTAPIGRFPPNRFGLHDMIGNVWAWAEDCWLQDYGIARSDSLPMKEPANCKLRAARGGGWTNPPSDLRSAVRVFANPRLGFNYVGIRVAAELE